MARKTANKKSTKQRTRKMKGGAGAAGHAIAVYGDSSSQHAKSDTDNTIASKQVGGKRRKQNGGVGLTEVMVPAIFLVANQMFKGSRSKTAKYQK